MDRGVIERDTELIQRNDARGIAGVNFLLGAWLVISPWILGYVSSQAKWNSVVFGLLIMLFGAVRYILPSQTWASWINGAVGVWMIIAPFILNYVKTAAYWNEIITGLIVAALAFSNLQYYGRHHRTAA